MSFKPKGDCHLRCDSHLKFWITVIFLLLVSCIPKDGKETGQVNTVEPTSLPAIATQTITPVQILNPLTGLPVADPSLLELPALLVSISHFPVTARPQAGLSFAPLVFEIYITEGATRFLTTFYGGFPVPEVPLTGNCETRKEIFTQTNIILGNRVWHDANKNNEQDPNELGIGGVCVNLYDANNALLRQTTTDSNGYYGFDVTAGTYFVAFAQPPGMGFAQKNAGDEETDSDVGQASGWSDLLAVTSPLLHLDAGLVPLVEMPSPAILPEAKVGPVRSGRLVYADIASFFPDSCLIYAFASPEILSQLPQCAFVSHDVQGGGYMLNINEMKRLAQDSKKPNVKIDYASNVYSNEPPDGGTSASRLDVFIAYLNQSAWVYDALSQSWWRYVDEANPDTAGVLHPEVDRLTNRQLHVENIVVVFAKHEVVSPTNLEIHLEQGLTGAALIFRDGKKYEIRWSTSASEEELRTGRRKPIQFLHPDGRTLFPLKPGHTWVIVVTPQTAVTERSSGEWLLQFSQPPGAK